MLDPFAYVPRFSVQLVPVTVTGSFNTNVTYSFLWGRQANLLILSGSIAFAGGTNVTSFTLNTPTINGTQLVIDTAQESIGNSSLNSMNTCGHIFKTGTGRLPLIPTYSSSTVFSALTIAPAAASVHYFSQVSDSFPGTWVNGDYLIYYVEVPILGWGVGGSRDF